MIRPSQKEDLPSLLSLAEDSGLFPKEQLDVLEGMLTSFFEVGEENEGFWLTDHDGNSVGVAFCEPELMTNETWNLRLIAVAPELQRSGRGAALLSHIEQLLFDRGGRLLIVDTSGTEDFESVREFYRRCGYAEESRIRDFFDDGDDKVTFTKRLDNAG